MYRTFPIASAMLMFIALTSCSRGAPEPTLDPEEMLHLRLVLDQTVVADDDMDAVVMIDLASSETPLGDRAPVSLALVFDTSGSMEGNKIENAREAAHGLVDALSVGDSITLVSFADTATAHLENYRVGVDREEAHEAINDLEARGNTCTSCGLDQAYLILQRAEVEPIRRVILLSDGHANRGIQGEDHLRNLAANSNAVWNIDTATIGLGRLHNEAVMAAVAEGGAATYYFLHNSGYLAGILERELTSLHSTVLTDLVLRIQPGDGVVLTGTENTGAYWDGPDLVFNLGQLAVGDTRQLVVTVRLPEGDMGRAVFARAEFYDIMGAAYALEDSARVERSQDLVQIESSANKAVTERYLELTAARRIEEAMNQIELENRDEAIQILEETAVEIGGYAEMFESPGLEFQAEELRTISETFGDEDDQLEADDERANIIFNRARSSESRRGTPAAQTYHQPEMYDLTESE